MDDADADADAVAAERMMFCAFVIKLCGKEEWNRTQKRKVRLMGWNVYCKRRYVFSLLALSSVVIFIPIVLTQRAERYLRISSQLFVCLFRSRPRSLFLCVCVFICYSSHLESI